MKLDREKCVVWSVNGVWILAECGHDARILYDREYGRRKTYDIKGVRRGFRLVGSPDDTPEKVSLREFVRRVSVHGDGIVSVMD
jgi:hypothetical protein